jgi:RNA polymerase sigma-70 factor (ECF subfamily)
MAELKALSRTPDEEIEKALLIRYRQHHDDSVFREIHDHFHSELHNFIRGHLLSAFDAESDTEEILQETFLDLFCYRDQLQPATQLRAALYTIAKNNVDDHLRKAEAQKRDHHKNEGSRDLDKGIPSPKTDPAVRDRRILLRELLQKLPPTEADALRLVDLEGHTIPSAAELLGLPESTVWSRLRSGRKHLKELSDE